MTTLFLLSLAVILYTYAGYPLAIAALARLRPRPWTKSPITPSVTVIMAVHNGAAMLPAQLDHLTSLDPTLVHEIIVVSDGSTDQTPEILLNFHVSKHLGAPHLASEMWVGSPQPPAPQPLNAPQTPDFRLRPIILPTHSGKSTALNAALAAATADILLFIDIRPKVQPGALPALLSNFADPTVGCVAGELLLNSTGHDAAAAAVSGLYWKYEQWMRNCEAAFDSPTGVYGGFYAIRRTLATPFPPGLILDDMFQPLSVIRQGYRSVLDRSAFVLDIWPATSAGEFSRKVRTLCGNFQLIQQAPWLLTPANRVLFQLVSHKLLRLVVPYAFIALFITSAILAVRSLPHTTFALILCLVQGAFWIMALASLFVRVPAPFGRLANPAGALLVLNAAAIAALFRFLFTRTPLWQTWKPTPTPSKG